MRGILAGLAALLLAALPDESVAQLVPGAGCWDPTVAVSTFVVNFADAIELSDDPGHLKDQCKDFLEGCKKTIRHVTKCIESGNAVTENAAIEECNSIPDPQDRAACEDAIKTAIEDLDDQLDSQTSSAGLECLTCYEACLNGNTCEDGS